MRNYHHSLCGTGCNFEIFAQSSGMIQPREGTFDDPPFGEYMPAFLLAAADYVHRKTQLFPCLIHECSPIASIRAKTFNSWIEQRCIQSNQNTHYCVMEVGGVHNHSEQVAHNICDYMAFSTFNFFSRHPRRDHRWHWWFLRFASPQWRKMGQGFCQHFFLLIQLNGVVSYPTGHLFWRA